MLRWCPAILSVLKGGSTANFFFPVENEILIIRKSADLLLSFASNLIKIGHSIAKLQLFKLFYVLFISLFITTIKCVYLKMRFSQILKSPAKFSHPKQCPIVMKIGTYEDLVKFCDPMEPFVDKLYTFWNMGLSNSYQQRNLNFCFVRLPWQRGRSQMKILP